MFLNRPDDRHHPVPPFSFGAGNLLLVQRISPVLGDLLTDLAWWPPVSETPIDIIPDG
jgi:hypothetical protein